MVSLLVLDPVYPPLLDLLSVGSVYRREAEERYPGGMVRGNWWSETKISQ
jgi:hypothetical protein